MLNLGGADGMKFVKVAAAAWIGSQVHPMIVRAGVPNIPGYAGIDATTGGAIVGGALGCMYF